MQRHLQRELARGGLAERRVATREQTGETQPVDFHALLRVARHLVELAHHEGDQVRRHDGRLGELEHVLRHAILLDRVLAHDRHVADGGEADGRGEENVELGLEGGLVPARERLARIGGLELRGRHVALLSVDDVLAAVEELAKLHLVLQKVEDENLKIGGQDYAMEVFRHNRELKKVRNYIHGKHKKNEFEMIFMRNYEIFLKQALDVEHRLMKPNPGETQGQSGKQSREAAMYGICHGDFNQHNVLFTHGKIIITNFEQAHYDVLVGDLAHFLRKLMEKHNFNIGLATDMLAAYEKRRKLLPEEWEQLYVRMAYPQKFWKVANHYFNANKAWVSGRDIEKLNRVIEQEEIRQQFLRMLFYFVE